VVLAICVVAGVLIIQGAPAMADDPVSDLGFTYSASPTGSSGDPWTAGSNATLTATVTNYGPDEAPDNTVTIGIPGGTDYVSDDGGCTGTGVLTCVGGSLANGASRAISVIVKVHSDIAEGGNLGPLNAYVQTTGGEGTDDHSNNGTIEDVYVHRIANVAIVKAGPEGIDPDLVVAGDDNGYDYTITVSTAGPSDTGYLVHDTLADGLTFDSSDAGCSAVGQDVTCGGTIAAGDSPQTITIHVLVDPSVADGTILDNDATVDLPSDGTTDPDLTNNTTVGDSTVSTTITAQADLGLGVVATGGQNVAGASAGIDFVYTVSTGGPSDNVGGFKVTDALPAGFVFKSSGSSAACSASGQDITCTDTNGFPDGAVNRTFTVHAHINSSVAADDYSDLATVTSLGTQDPNSANDTDTGTVTVITQADLSLTTAAVTYPTGQTAAFANNVSTQNFAIYEYDVKNNGPSDAQNVSFDDSIPTGLTLVGACVGSSCTSFSSLPLSVGTLNGNDGMPTKQSKHIRVKVTANANLRNGPLTKTDNASVTSDTTDQGPSLNARSESATVWTVPSSPTNPDGRPGNHNAYFLWQQSLSANGGSAIDFFAVTVAGPTTPTVPNVDVNDACGTNGNNNQNSMIFCTQITPLNNPPVSTPYTFTVKAHNAVGLSDPATSGPVVPSVNASAQQIKTGSLSQQTGNGANPTAGDPIITTQTFNPGTAGIGLLQERAAPTNFCGGKCIGGTVLVNELEDPNAPTGFYQVNILYYKSLINGTGIKTIVYFAPNDTDPTGSQLPTCPSKITNITTDCAIVKLGNQGANPALRIVVYTNRVDPTVGARGIPK
jgi:uncharacterized repeat protein (TIGR01451 family)